LSTTPWSQAEHIQKGRDRKKGPESGPLLHGSRYYSCRIPNPMATGWVKRTERLTGVQYGPLIEPNGQTRMGSAMNKRITLVFLSALIFLVISCSQSKEQTLSNPQASFESSQIDRIETDGREEEETYRAGEVLVKFKDHVTEKQIEEIVANLNLETIEIVSPPNLYLFKIPKGSSVHDMIERLKRFKEVQYSEPNYIRKVF
jgi:hypothetical protein